MVCGFTPWSAYSKAVNHGETKLLISWLFGRRTVPERNREEIINSSQGQVSSTHSDMAGMCFGKLLEVSYFNELDISGLTVMIHHLSMSHPNTSLEFIVSLQIKTITNT